MEIILSHPTGNANVRAAALSLLEASLLAEFHTTVACFEGSLLDKFGAVRMLSEIRRRRFHPALRSVTKLFPWFELGRLISGKAGLSKLTEQETGLFSIDSVYQKLDRHVSSRLKELKRGEVKGIYAYEDGAEYSFRNAKKLGFQCFYDLPTGYWRSARNLLQKEQYLRPEWMSTMSGFKDSDSKLMRKDKELEMADRIFVATKFTANTLQDYPGKLPPIDIIPYGFPSVCNQREYQVNYNHRPLKILYVGKITQQKGIANLLEAVEKVTKYVELTVVGRKAVDDCDILNKLLKKHTWIPSLSHPEVLKLMRENDVLVFPSLFDGFGLVITEAMAQGTPVIATERCAGPDLITHGKNGWLMEAGSTLALERMLNEILNQPENVAKVGYAAMDSAAQRPWDIYRYELALSIMRHFVEL